MSTNVQIIDILRALYRWDSNDVKLLFINELNELFRENRHSLSESQLNSVHNQSTEICVQNKCNESDSKIKILENNNKNMREGNKKLYEQGLKIIEEMSEKIKQLEKSLTQSTTHSKSLWNQLLSLGKTADELKNENEFLKTISDVMKVEKVMNDINICNQRIQTQTQQIEELEKGKQVYQNWSQSSVKQINSLKAENLKLKQEVQEKNNATENLKKNAENYTNLVTTQLLDYTLEVFDETNISKENIESLFGNKYNVDNSSQTDGQNWFSNKSLVYDQQ